MPSSRFPPARHARHVDSPDSLLEPAHGYAIAQRLRQVSRSGVQVNQGSLYPALQRMLRAGWVKARWDTSPTGRRVRVYAITPVGKTRLEREVSNFERMLEGIRLVLAPVKS